MGIIGGDWFGYTPRKQSPITKLYFLPKLSELAARVLCCLTSNCIKTKAIKALTIQTI